MRSSRRFGPRARRSAAAHVLERRRSLAVATSLARVPLFEALPPDKLTALDAAAQRRSFRRGAVLFHEGDDGTSLFLIIERQVKIVLPSDSGEEALLMVLDSGDFFGEM